MHYTKTYELTNHLGNVLTVISDRKIAVVNASAPTVVDHFNPEILSASDYFCFGATMNSRKYTSSSYRYGFNGKENDKETAGTLEGTLDFGCRIYDGGVW